MDSIAEQELLKCAQIIADAAKTLLQARPKTTKKIPGQIDQQDINDAILEGAGAIATATGQLVQAAAVAQQERMKMLKEAPGQKKYMADPTWANGLISAAQNVAGAVSQLVKSANESVEGKAQEEGLFSFFSIRVLISSSGCLCQGRIYRHGSLGCRFSFQGRSGIYSSIIQ